MIIRYRYAGRTRELRIPTALWSPFVDEVRLGRLDQLAVADGPAGWTPWGDGGGEVARGPSDDVLIRPGRAGAAQVSHLPAIIWDQILVAVRAHAVDDLDARGDAESSHPRPTGFRTVHGSALGAPHTQPDNPDRSPPSRLPDRTG